MSTSTSIIHPSTCGIILAAGASSRMGSPKALLPTASGLPLMACQAALLMEGGCTDVLTVIGRHAREIESAATGIRLVRNEQWQRGRTSSVQTGLTALAPGQAALVLPVDTVGVKPRTIAGLLQAAQRQPTFALRPVHKGQRGRLAWLSPACIGTILSLPPETRLDEWLASRELQVETEDAAILRNINTPADWLEVRGTTG